MAKDKPIAASKYAVTPKEMTPILSEVIKAGFPTLIRGAPGIGKTDIVKQVGKTLDYDCIILHPAISEPTDFKGMPWITNVKGQDAPKAFWVAYDELLALVEAKKETICFLDDLGQAAPQVQAAIMQLLHGGTLNDVKISPLVRFVAATNRKEDNAAVSGLLDPVRTRFSSILELCVDVDSWLLWATNNAMPADLIAFIHNRKELIEATPAIIKKAEADIGNYPNPRTIANLGKIYNLGIEDKKAFSSLAAGAVGEAFAFEFCEFVETRHELPDIREVYKNPEKCKLPSEDRQDLRYIFSINVALGITTADECRAVFKVVKRMTGDFAAVIIKTMIENERINKIMMTKCGAQWTKFSEENSDVFFGEITAPGK